MARREVNTYARDHVHRCQEPEATFMFQCRDGCHNQRVGDQEWRNRSSLNRYAGLVADALQDPWRRRYGQTSLCFLTRIFAKDILEKPAEHLFVGA